MTYQKLMSMRGNVNYFYNGNKRHYSPGLALTATVNDIIGLYFWDFETDMPKVNFNQLTKFIKNTVEKAV